MRMPILLLLLLLLNSCVTRDNPYDPDAENYDPFLHYASNTIRISPDIISSNSATLTLEIIKLQNKASTFHLVFEDKTIIVESVEINSSLPSVKALPLNNDNRCNIIAITPVTGTTTIAQIHISNISASNSLKLYFAEDENDDGTVVINEVDNKITELNWLTPTIIY